jgi:hydroxypyruvate isomerase
MKQSFCLPCFRQPDQPLVELFDEAVRIGYTAVELWSPPTEGESLEEIHELALASGLVVSSITGHNSIENGLNDPDHWSRIEHELIQSIDLAAILKIPGIICFSGTRRPGISDDDGLSLFIQVATRIVGHAEAKGVNLNLEVLNSRIDHSNYMADSVGWAIAACEGVGSPRMKLLFDVYHVQIMEGDLIRNLRRAAPYLGHIHTAGNPGRHELDDDQEINYRAIGRELNRLGYEGFVGHELFAKGDKMGALQSSFDAMI